MEREIWLERMRWMEIQGALADRYDAVVIFTGSIEQHGRTCRWRPIRY